MKLMTDTEMECLVALLEKAIRCEELVVHIPANEHSCAQLVEVTDWCINGNCIQLELED